MAKNLTTAALGAMRWNYAGFLSRTLAGFAVGIVLARLLGPGPFGQIGIAALLFGLGNLFADAGFSSALVQAPELSERQIRFIFTMQLVIGLGMTALAWVAAGWLGGVFRDPAITPVIRGTSPLFLAQCLGQTSTGLLKRRMAFKRIQVAQVSSYLIGYLLVGVTMACLGYGVWSLVAAQLAQPMLYSAIIYSFSPHPLRPCFDRSGMRLLRFGTQVTGANTINWTISNLDNIVVARTFGDISLGLYSRAFNLASNPVEGFIGACQQVLFASCSRAGGRYDSVRRAYLACVGGVALIAMPVCWSLAVSSHTVVLGLYGSKWGAVVPLFAAIATAMPLFALMALAGPILGAADRVDQEIRTQGISLAVSAALFIGASRFSLAAVAWAVVAAYGFRFWCATRPTLRLIGLRWRNVLAVLAGPACAALFTASCVYGTAQLADMYRWKPGIPLVLLLALAGGVAFSAAVMIAGRLLVPPALLEPLVENSRSLPGWFSQHLEWLAADRTQTGSRPDADAVVAGS